MVRRLSTKIQLQQIWSFLSPRRKRQLAVLSVLMVLTSVAEVLSIGAVLPFLGALTSPEKIFSHKFAQPVITLFQIESAGDLLLPFTLLFIFAAIFAGFVRITFLWAQMRLSVAIGADFSVQVYERVLFQPYSLHISRNSSEILAGLSKASSLVGAIIHPAMQIISSFVILAAVVIAILTVQPSIAISAVLGFGLIYLGVIFLTRQRISKNSRTIALQHGRVTKAIQEGLGGIRDVLLNGTQRVYSELYKDAYVPMQIASANNQVISQSPRFGVEALGMVLIASLIYVFVATSGVTDGVASTIPVLGALAFSAQRLLPVIQQIYACYITIRGNQAGTQDALDFLAKPLSEYIHKGSEGPLAFQNAISFKNLSFRYNPDGPWVLRHLDLMIQKGSRVGFIGVTGSGKSTLLDLFMGLLAPTEGVLAVDSTVITPENTRSWQKHISHVPQEIYLSDSSITENIAFGVPKELIDLSRVKGAAQRAQISGTIEEWRDGYDTLVGERGVRLSGGQRQRIGIARAIYKQASVIIFDEATSALDHGTEEAVMQAIEKLSSEMTILIVAHRLTTLKKCDLIVELVDGSIKATGGYEQVVRWTA